MKIDENFFNSNLINGIIVFLLPNAFNPIFSNFASPELIRTLKNNDYIKIIILYFIIFFFIQNIIEKDKTSQKQITTELLIAFIILVFIILFTRQTQNFNILQFLFLLTIYILDLNNLNYTIIYTFYGLLIFSLFLGFYFYYIKQLKDKGNKFSYIKFLIGNKEKDYLLS